MEQYSSLVHFLCQEGQRTNRWHHFLLRTITQEQAGSLQKCWHRHNKPGLSQEHTQTHNDTIVSSKLSISSVYWHIFEALYISVCLYVFFYSLVSLYFTTFYLISVSVVVFFGWIWSNISPPASCCNKCGFMWSPTYLREQIDTWKI